MKRLLFLLLISVTANAQFNRAPISGPGLRSLPVNYVLPTFQSQMPGSMVYQGPQGLGGGFGGSFGLQGPQMPPQYMGQYPNLFQTQAPFQMPGSMGMQNFGLQGPQMPAQFGGAARFGGAAPFGSTQMPGQFPNQNFGVQGPQLLGSQMLQRPMQLGGGFNPAMMGAQQNNLAMLGGGAGGNPFGGTSSLFSGGGSGFGGGNDGFYRNRRSRDRDEDVDLDDCVSCREARRRGLDPIEEPRRSQFRATATDTEFRTEASTPDVGPAAVPIRGDRVADGGNEEGPAAGPVAEPAAAPETQPAPSPKKTRKIAPKAVTKKVSRGVYNPRRKNLSAKQLARLNRLNKDERRAMNAPIWNSFITNFHTCAPAGCEPVDFASYGQRSHESCHSQGKALDVHAMLCKDGLHQAINTSDPTFYNLVKCMSGLTNVKVKMKVLYHNKPYNHGANKTEGHYDHAHFSNGCTLSTGAHYW